MKTSNNENLEGKIKENKPNKSVLISCSLIILGAFSSMHSPCAAIQVYEHYRPKITAYHQPRGSDALYYGSIVGSFWSILSSASLLAATYVLLSRQNR